MDINKTEIKRYLESYKRMFFKDQLDNPRSKAILEKRKEVLNLKDIDVSEVELEIKEKLINGVDFIRDLLKEEKELSDSDRLEADKYFENIGLDKIDVDSAMELVKEKSILVDTNNVENSIDMELSENSTSIEGIILDDNFGMVEELRENDVLIDSLEEIDEVIDVNQYLDIFSEDNQKLIENDEFFYDYLDINSREFKLESLKVLFFNGCLMCLEKLKDKMGNLEITEIHSREKIFNIFYDTYGDLINYTYGVLIKEEMCEVHFSKTTLFEKIFGLQCIGTLIKQMNKISIMFKNNIAKEEIEKSVEKSINVYKNNSEKEYFKTFSIITLEEEIEKIFDDFVNKHSFNSVLEKSLISLFMEAMKFINKCAVANFDIYTDELGRNLNELLEASENINNAIQDKASYLSDLDSYMELIKNLLKQYPFSETLYIEFGYFKVDTFIKYDYLNKAVDIIDNCGEKNSKILEEIKLVEIDLYNEYLSRIPNDLSNGVKIALSYYCARKFNLQNNMNVIFEGEMDKFGDVLSEIDIENVDINLRSKIFRKKLQKIKEDVIEDKELIEIINTIKEKYKISNWEAFKGEYSIFGIAYEENVFDNLDENDRKSLLNYCMNSIKEISANEDEKIEYLLKLQERNIVNKKIFRDVQYEVFDEVIALTELEKKEFEFSDSVKSLYNKYLEKVIKLDISVKDDKDTIIIPEFYEKFRDEDEDEPIFIYSEESNFSSKSESFIITNRRIYSSYESDFIELSDIIEFKLESYSRVIKGERIFFEGIFVKAKDKEYKLCSNLSYGKEELRKLLCDILDEYRRIFVVAKIIEIEAPMEEIVSFMDETASLENKKLMETLKLNLYGNKFYELMSDLLNCGSIDIDDIILELSNIISIDLGKKLFFKDITAGYSEKLSNACGSYVLEIDKAEEVLFVYDNSRFGSAKEGFILTDKGIYCKNRMGTPWFMELKYIDTIKAKENNKILINNRIIELAHIKTKEQLYEMRDLLELAIFMNSMDATVQIEEDVDKSPILNYIMELLNSIKSENLRKFLYMHTEGKIAEKKFNNAVNSYADLDENEKPLLLFDNSVFAFGNTGFLVTTKNIYSKEAMGKSIRFNLGAVYKIKFKSGNFYINSVLLKLNGLTEDDKEELSEKMLDLVEYLKDNFFKKAIN